MAVIDALTAKARNWLKKTGDTMISGYLTLFQDPTEPLHAVTKQYVDSHAVALPPKRLMMAVKRDQVSVNLDTFGWVLTDTAATTISLATADGTYYNLATVNVNTNSGVISSQPVTRRELLPQLTLRHRTGAHANTREWIGFFSGNPMLSDTPAVSIIAFRASASAGDTTWKAVTSDGVGITVTDTTIPFTAATPYDFTIDCSNPGSFVFTANGISKTLTNNLPALGTDLFYYEHHRILTASVGCAVNIGYIRLFTR